MTHNFGKVWRLCTVARLSQKVDYLSWFIPGTPSLSFPPSLPPSLHPSLNLVLLSSPAFSPSLLPPSLASSLFLCLPHSFLLSVPPFLASSLASFSHTFLPPFPTAHIVLHPHLGAYVQPHVRKEVLTQSRTH
eukprot:6193061-Pleurochrysis_carterae.AAC.2